MKVLKAIVSAIACILIVGGVIVFLVTVAYNLNTLKIILADPVVQASISILLRLLYCVAAVLVGFIFLTIAVRIGVSIRAKEKEQRKKDYKRRKEEEWEEEKEELLKGYSEDELKG